MPRLGPKEAPHPEAIKWRYNNVSYEMEQTMGQEIVNLNCIITIKGGHINQ
jgi:hypothetical protein